MYSERTNKAKSRFYKRISDIEKPLARIIKKKENKQYISMRN